MACQHYPTDDHILRIQGCLPVSTYEEGYVALLRRGMWENHEESLFHICDGDAGASPLDPDHHNTHFAQRPGHSLGRVDMFPHSVGHGIDIHTHLCRLSHIQQKET